MQARFIRAIIVGAVAGTLISLCTLVSQVLIDRVTAPIFAQGLDGGESGPACGICLLNYLLVAIIFALAGAVTVAWCGELLSSQDKAIKTAVVTGVAACIASSIILFIPVLLQQIHNNDRIFPWVLNTPLVPS